MKLASRLTTPQLMAELRARGVRIWLDEVDQLRFRALKGALDAEMRAELGQRREEIVAFLAHARAATAPVQDAIRRPPEVAPSLSFAQERLWFLDRVQPDSAVFVLVEGFRLRGDLSTTCLDEALRFLIRRHPGLRTSFEEIDGKPVPRIHDRPRWHLEHLDLSDRTDAEARVREDASAFAARPFPLDCAPLFRARLLRLAADEHVLFLGFHHIIADDWSMSVFRAELARVYRALVTGTPHEMDEPAHDYTDFAWWQRTRAEQWESLQDWWARRVADAPQWDLPHVGPRPPRQSYAGACRSFAFDAEDTARLHRLAAESRTTLFQVLVTGFAAAAQRLSGCDDLILGTSTGARPARGFEEVLGLFVNLLPLRVDLGGDPSGRELLARVRRTTTEAYDRAELPFEKIVDAGLGGLRDPSRHPLFQTQVVLTNAVDHPLELPGLEVLPYVDGETRVARQDLSLVFREREGELHCDIEYCRDLFDGPAVDQLFARLRRILLQIVERPDRLLSELTLMEEEEETALMALSVRGGDHPPCDLGVLFQTRAGADPDAIALRHRDIEWTYGQLSARAHAIAAELLEAGIEPDINVGVCLEPGPELVAALLGVILAGGAYVPLAPEYPVDRLAFMIGDAAPLAVITDDAHEAKLPAFELAGLAVVNLDELEPSEAVASLPSPRPDLDHLAYVVYTSGTTGRPKGVQVTHRNVLRLVFDREYLSVAPGDGVVMASNIAFDALTFELWTSLLHGGELLIVDKNVFIDPESYAAVVARHRPAVMFTTTALFNQLARYDNGFFSGFDYVLFGGELVDPESVRLVRQNGPRHLLHVYGPTETTTYASWHPVREVAPDADNVPIGRPIANTSLFVLDRALRPVPLGVPGELYIGGAGLARGYLDRPALTADRFVPNPLAGPDDRGSRLYRTGDLVRRDAQGDIEFLGRVDHQVKIRGFRIEPGEIESILFKHAAVDEAVVVVARDTSENAPASAKRLVAYVQHAADHAPTAAELRAWCEAHLPPHMVPALFVVLAQFPLNPNGKVDRAALPEPIEAPKDSLDQAPRDEIERLLTEIWADAMGRPQVGIHENFFELGGDSLLSIRIKAAARDAGLDFPLQEIFERGTVAGLAEGIRTRATTPEASVGQPDGSAVDTWSEPFVLVPELDRVLLPQGLEDAFPMSQLQLGLIYHGAYEQDPGLAHYQIVLIYRVDQPFDRSAMRAALGRVVANHGMLRTAFDLDTFAEPMQLVYREAELPLAVTDISAEPDREGWLATWMTAERERPFAWDRPPLARLHCFTHGSDSFHLGLTFHHAVMDGWSDAALLRELLDIYGQIRLGLEPGMQPPDLSYRRFVELEREAMADRAQRLFWHRQVADLEPVRLGEDRDDHGEGVRDLYLSTEVSAGLHRLVRRTGAPLKSVLLSAYLEVLRRLQGGEEVVAGLVTHGRPEERDGDRIIGLFVNMLPLRFTAPRGSWLEMVQAAHDAEQALAPHRRFPLAAVMRHRGNRPLYDAVFNFTHFHLDAENQAEDQGVVPVMGSGDTHFALLANFGMEPGSRIITAHLRYDRGRIAPALAHEIGCLTEEVLRTMATAPETSVRAFSASTARALIPAWTRLEDSRAVRRDPLDRFRDQVAANPEATALISRDENMSYRELSAFANRIAHGLKSRGVCRERPVGLCLDSGCARVAAVLGILGAGGFYVPLDPEYPPERLAFMVENLGIRHIVAEPAYCDRFPVDVATLELDEWVAGQPETAPEAAFLPDQLAYVIFTSGSSGRPKGVAVTRDNIETLIDGQNYIEHSSDQVYVQSAAFSFDATTFEIWAPLTTGARLVLPTADERHDLPRTLVDHGVTVLFVTSRLFDSLVEDHLDALRGLRYILTGGEVLAPESIARLLREAPDVCLEAMYGPTETTTFTSAGDLSRIWSGEGPIPLGLPLHHTAIYVLDEDLNPVAPGLPGQIYIAGARLARGYWGAPALTADRFIPNPFAVAGQVGSRLYRTGDRAAFVDGQLQFLGRMDRQVKIRGFRVEPGEVERELCAHDAVTAAYVAVERDGDRALLAAWVAIGDVDLDGAALRAWLSDRLPAHLVPGAIQVMDQFPLTLNGKLNKVALPKILVADIRDEQAYEAPDGAMERLLAATWCDLFDLARVSRHEHFLELGGHSITATRLIARLRRVLDADVPVRLVFEHPTLSELASALEARGLTAPAEAARSEREPEIPVVPRDGALPLSFAQERLFFFEKVHGGETPVFLLPEVLELRGPLDADLLERAFLRVVAEQESLRTRFEERDGQPCQTILSEVAWHLDHRDLSETAEDVVAELVRDLCHRPFSLDEVPLLRAHLLRLAEDRHLLVVVFHHIVADGWSMECFRTAWTAHYAALAAGHHVPADPPRLQVADFAAWQRARWDQGKAADDMAWWADRLADLPLLDLPADRPRPAVLSHRGAVLQTPMSADLTRRIHDFARERQVSVYAVLLGCFHALLARLTGSRDVACGISTATRPSVALERLLGCFVNLLVVRTDLHDNPDFGRIATRAQAAIQDALTHAEAPFEKVAEQQGGARDLSRHPLVGTQCVYVSPREEGHGQVGDLPFELGPYAWDGVAATRNDLTFLFRDDPDGLHLVVEYNADLFDEATAAGFVTRYQVLLEGALAQPTDALSRLPLLTEADRAVIETQSTHHIPLPTQDLAAMFAAKLADRPDAVAVEMADGSQALTYAELDAWSRSIAAELVQLGVGLETPVGLCLAHGPGLVAAVLAVIRLGAVYVPLPPDAPAERLAFMIGDSGMTAILTDGDHEDRLPAFELNFVSLLCIEEATEPALNLPEPCIDGDNLAYIVYTSGTTGRPKGVQITHDNVKRLVCDTEYVALRPGDGVALASNIAFDALTFELWTALLHGGRLVALDKQLLLDADALRAVIEQRRIDALFTTTALFNQFALHRPDLFAGMRYVLFGGELVDPKSVAAILPQGPERLLHVYGPTETTTFATWQPLTEVPADARNLPLGGPIANTDLWLLDPELEPVPCGVTGELYIGGEGLARGYLDRADLTAERFVPHPFASRPGARLYRTGDLMRRLPGGALEFVGRVDHQVKIRGFRIEPAEIEAALMAMPEVSGALVSVVRDDDGTGAKRLVAWLQVDAHELDARTARDVLAERLPDYMIPVAWSVTARFPLNANGKIDRARLPEPVALVALDTGEAAPLSPLERRLAEVWAEVLHRPHVGADESFFDLGGDSLLAIQVKAKSAERGMDFPLRHLFDRPTVRQIAASIEAAESDGVSTPQTAGVTHEDAELLRGYETPFSLLDEDERAGLPDDVVDAYPMSRLQEGMLFHAGLAEDSAIYHDVIAYRVALPLDEGALRDSLTALAGIHPILRTSFHLDLAKRPLQFVHARVDMPLAIVDWRDHTDPQAAFDTFLETEKRVPFAWERAPLMRIFAHHLAEDRFRLTFSFHHAILDGWSEATLFTRLLNEYRTRLAGEPSTLASERVPYRAFIALEQAACADETVRGWWRELLADAEATSLPRAVEPGSADADPRVTIPFNAADAAAARRLATEMGVPLKTVALATHLAAIGYLGGRRDLVTGLVANGRPEVLDGEQTLGLFLNTLPLRFDLGTGTWADLLRRTLELERAMLTRRRLPLAEIQRMMGAERLFETAFNFIHFHVYEDLTRGGGRELVLDREGHARADFPLFAHFAVDPDSGRLHAHLEFEPSRLHPRDAARCADVYAAVLRAMTADPQSRQDLFVPLPKERLADLAAWQQGPRLDFVPIPLDRQFAAQAARTPERVAVRHQGQAWTYAQLAVATAAVADRLRAAGVGPGKRVGVCLGREPHLPAALLAVMQVGAAYVPLDPDYPESRLRAIAEDADLCALIGSRAWAADGQLVSGAKAVPLIEPVAPHHEAPAAVPECVSMSTAEAPAYIIYTSGSTGRPKGVAISHRNAAYLLAWGRDRYSREDLDGVLAATSVCFDLSVFELFLPLSCGGGLILVDNALALNDVPDQARVTLINTVPSAIQALLPRLAIRPRVINLAGEPLHPELVDAIAARLPETRVFDLYGPSEATTYATGAERTALAGATIGRPLANTRAYVLDAALRPVPPGTLGELYLGGAGVVLGYHARPVLTAASFVPDPFSAKPGARLYRTGDLVRWREDGNLTFHGRRDHQIKLRGFRIELGEIESALRTCPGVHEAAVVVHGRGPEALLVAHVAADSETTAVDLRTRLAAHLPAFMIPGHILIGESLPHLPNGKLDRAALPAPEVEATRAYAAPQGELEIVIAQDFARVLGRDDTESVGRHDDFFELGGQSLLAVRLIARLRERFSLDLPQRLLFENPDVAGLAARIETLRVASDYLARGAAVDPVGVDPSVNPTQFDEGEL
ncbi:Amino acid adenylation domain-containing protein [Sulfidibacter corallicola]|uniref:Amino acid adenylation domain-containing protein n=1 Tax=Sulfidibacter corallicola TaxID=2818388 RepID=A0A8A4TTI9_SULCO|nr:non-ribosomal peptide synthetase [Sulfidibacter corallicola]QTD52362.1 amino acid adenylation domain-containing protein [Sulfidibacter corallicola]